MEDIARLAVVEQGVRDINKFSFILHKLLEIIDRILANPHDNNVRSIKPELLKNVLNYGELSEYLKYIGFQWMSNDFIFPKNETLNKLRMAKVAIEKKISLCCVSQNIKQITHKTEVSVKKYKLTPTYVLKTSNPLLSRIQTLFNSVLDYEDEELVELAKQEMPVLTLKVRALERIREHQENIKRGKTTDEDLPYEKALLMELLIWFKYTYFSWVDVPACDACGNTTKFIHKTTMQTETETCGVEVYKCNSCGAMTRFPRHNDARALLRTRRGRCGEWANCFALFCRALQYDTRLVCDTSDHVWCEVFDFETSSWCHVDPCEVALDTPLMYAHGWGKKLSYVIAVSADDVQDVTWRYTMDHKEVLSRRSRCSEDELITSLLLLRAHRQAQVSASRRKYLAARTLRELAQLMLERKPSDLESHGRKSGSRDWRTQRRELGQQTGYTFQFKEPGLVSIRYYSSPDHYRITCNGRDSTVDTWVAGVNECTNVFRKIEKDWRQVYLAREEGESLGSISWKLSVPEGLEFTSLNIALSSTVFETGNIQWKLQFNESAPIDANLGETNTEFERRFSSVIIMAHLTGGNGNVAWQHAQLFRQSLDSKMSTFEIRANIHKA